MFQLFRQYKTLSFDIFKNKFTFKFIFSDEVMPAFVLYVLSFGFSLDLPIVSYDNSLAAIYCLLIYF